MSAPLLVARDVFKGFRARTELASLWGGGASVVAVDGVSFEIGEGEILGLVGESGSGKTTLGRLVVGLDTPDRGDIRWRDGRNVAALRARERRAFYREVQMVFQDPYESLDPSFTVQAAVAEPLRAQRLARRQERTGRVSAALERAGLRPASAFLSKYPHELSGGERQRVSIARALIVDPKLLVADEPVSMLDVSIRAGILNLLRQLRRELGLSLLYISHDLSTTRYLCDRIVIMYRGEFVEVGTPEQVIDAPAHPYAQALRSAIPVADPTVRRTREEPAAGTDDTTVPSTGCRYAPRCPLVLERCRRDRPPLRPTGPGHQVACHLHDVAPPPTPRPEGVR